MVGGVLAVAMCWFVNSVVVMPLRTHRLLVLRVVVVLYVLAGFIWFVDLVGGWFVCWLVFVSCLLC